MIKKVRYFVLACVCVTAVFGCSSADRPQTSIGRVESVVPGAGSAIDTRPLYRVRFRYSEGWEINLNGPGSTESQHFLFAEGRTEGRISGSLRGANHPQRRGDGTFVPDFQGVIVTDDGATIFFDWRGYGRAYPPGRRQIVAIGTHLADDERYRWLNDVVSVGVGEVREQADGNTELVVDWSEVVWTPIAD